MFGGRGEAETYIGCDARSPKYWPESFGRFIDGYGHDKVLFGTDFPVLDFARTRAKINDKRPDLLLR